MAHMQNPSGSCSTMYYHHPFTILAPQPCHNHFHPIPPGAEEWGSRLILPKLGKSKLFLGTLRRTSFAVEEEAEKVLSLFFLFSVSSALSESIKFNHLID